LPAPGSGTGPAQIRKRMPEQIIGPYCPVFKPAVHDVDLTRIKINAHRAAGQTIQISGQALNEAGLAVPRALIEVCCADSNAHCTHPSDRSQGVADPDFQRYAAFRSDRNGRSSFLTLKPGAYIYDGTGGMRTAHSFFGLLAKSTAS
jgi:protocatechuate 3,4-dioxygenase, beta subunit